VHQECFHVIEDQADRHWFFRGREAIVRSFLARRGRRLRVLDVGCGTGHLAAHLINDGYSVVGLEPDPTALAYARRRIPEAVSGDACRLPFPDASFDVVIATDVLEHIPDDSAAASEIRRVLRPGGWAILTVPAMPLLWGPQDIRLGHQRRYSRKSFARLLSGFRIRKISYFNTFLFPAILGARVLFRLLPVAARHDEVDMTPKFMNEFFLFFLKAERVLLRFVNLPFGVSLIAVAEKVGEV